MFWVKIGKTLCLGLLNISEYNHCEPQIFEEVLIPFFFLIFK